jgi:hypothetical protein
MKTEDAEIFRMFQFELGLLENGGYRQSARTPWRVPYAFEESPTCLKYHDVTRSHPCTGCPLMEFVPTQFREENAPCRFIPLTESGETADYFYRTGTQMELERALACWLHKQIDQMAKRGADSKGLGTVNQQDESATGVA